MPRQTNRAFGLIFAIIFAVVFAIGWLTFGARLYWALAAAMAVLATALICPGILLPLNRLWGWFAHRLATVNNFLLLGLFYYLLMTPLALMLRLFGWDPMRRRITTGAATYWTSVSRGTTDKTLRDMF